MLRDALTRAAAATEAALSGWRLDRLRRDLDRPLLVVAAGPILPVATLWARLHETRHPAWATCTQDIRHRPLPRDAAVVLLSLAGRHHDLLGAAEHLVSRGVKDLRAIISRAHTPLADTVRAGGGEALILPEGDPGDPFHLAVGAPLLVLAAALNGPGPFHDRFDQARIAPPPPTRPRAVVAVGAGLAAPAARDFAYTARAAGLAPAWSSSLRDLAHAAGGALAPDTWIVAFALGDQIPATRAQLAAFPPDRPVTLLTEPDPSPGAALGLFAQGRLTLAAALQRYQLSPPPLPPWAGALYRAAL